MLEIFNKPVINSLLWFTKWNHCKIKIILILILISYLVVNHCFLPTSTEWRMLKINFEFIKFHDSWYLVECADLYSIVKFHLRFHKLLRLVWELYSRLLFKYYHINLSINQSVLPVRWKELLEFLSTQYAASVGFSSMYGKI